MASFEKQVTDSSCNKKPKSVTDSFPPTKPSFEFQPSTDQPSFLPWEKITEKYLIVIKCWQVLESNWSSDLSFTFFSRGKSNSIEHKAYRIKPQKKAVAHKS
jgi:hypothetical protein